MFGSWVLNEIWIIDLSSALVGMLKSSSKLFLFSKKVHLNSVVRQLLELYCVVVIKHVTSLLLNLYTSDSGCRCVFGFEQNFWRIDGLPEKSTDRRIYIPLFISSFMLIRKLSELS